jgi:DNA-binding transcriptional LysR family regulator
LNAHGVPASAGDLEHHHCIGYLQNDGLIGPWYFKGQQPGEMERRVVQTRMAIGDGQGEVEAVLAGHGIGQLPTWLVRPHVESGAIIEVLPELATDGLPMNLVWLKSRENLPKVKALINYLGERLTPHGAEHR